MYIEFVENLAHMSKQPTSILSRTYETATPIDLTKFGNEHQKDCTLHALSIYYVEAKVWFTSTLVTGTK